MNRVLQHIGSKYPIVQAPMGWISRSKLASAVCNAGGFGIIETSSGQTEVCKREIEAMKELTDKPFGVNLPVLHLKDPAMIDFVANSGVKFVTTSAGNPKKFIGPLKEAGITVYHAVPNVAGALKSIEAGVDGLVVEGTEGGGFKNPNEVRLQRGEKKLTETEKENIKKYGFTGLEVMTYSFCNTEPGYHDWTCCTNFYNYLPGQKVLRKTFTQREIYRYKSKAALVNLVGIDPGDTMRR